MPADDASRSGDNDTAAAADDPASADSPIEPGTPALENVVFVLLGMAMALGVVLRLVQLFG